MNDIPLCKCSFCEHSIVKNGKISCKFGECVLDRGDIQVVAKIIKEILRR